MSELRGGTEQAHGSDVQPNTPLNVDGPSGPLFTNDPILEMAMLVELYVQDLTLLGLFVNISLSTAIGLSISVPNLSARRVQTPHPQAQQYVNF